MECEVCTKEIMAGKRCIDCFMSKKKKRPEVMDLPLELGQYTPVKFPSKRDTIVGEYGYPYIIDTGITNTTAHTLTSTETTNASGMKVRTYKVETPDTGIVWRQDEY